MSAAIGEGIKLVARRSRRPLPIPCARRSRPPRKRNLHVSATSFCQEGRSSYGEHSAPWQPVRAAPTRCETVGHSFNPFDHPVKFFLRTSSGDWRSEAENRFFPDPFPLQKRAAIGEESTPPMGICRIFPTILAERKRSLIERAIPPSPVSARTLADFREYWESCRLLPAELSSDSSSSREAFSREAESFPRTSNSSSILANHRS